MIYEGLMFGALFELGVGSSCVHIAQVIRPVVQLTFTFVQLYFIFLNSKVCILFVFSERECQLLDLTSFQRVCPSV